MTNLAEYRAGTDPQDAQSRLNFSDMRMEAGLDRTSLSFMAASNKTYTVEHRSVVHTGAWTRLVDVVAASTNRLIKVTGNDTAQNEKYYRVGTPRR